jgi:multicomponent Na+:H+ antiporter subunit D
MILDALPPGLPLVLGAAAVPLLPVREGRALVLGLPLLALVLVWAVPDGPAAAVQFLDYTLEPVKGDRLSRLFGTIFALMGFVGGLFALRQARTLELSAALLYSGAALGVVFAGDLITLFACWELMAVGSTLVVWSAGTEESYRASMRYLMVHLFGGVVLMAGIAAHVAATGMITFAAMRPEDLATWLILAGFLLNAGAPPLSAWLPDAYPEASASGAVFLSAFTTKTAVYVLARGFPGAEILIGVGLYMIFYGIIYALLENDMRRILAYSIVNQVGFMVCGIGIGTTMALNGAVAHAFTHIIYKALLLMSAGAVLHMTGKRKCTELGGLFQSMPVTTACGVIGALSISSFPLTSGFISKAMISQAAADEHMALAWYLLAAASAGVFLHAGIKFPWYVFFQRDSGLRPPDPPGNMRTAMIVFAIACIALGVYPTPLYAILPYPVSYAPYTGAHVLGQMQLLLFSGLAFFVMLPVMKRTLTISLDFDWFYRMLLPGVSGWLYRHTRPVDQRLRRDSLGAARSAVQAAARYYGPGSGASRPWSTAGMLWLVLAALGGLLVFYLG